MSEPLWDDALDCGCRAGVGHGCRPLFMTEEEWLPTANDRAFAVDSGDKAAPAGNRGLTPNLTQSGNEASVDSTHSQSGRHPNSRGA